MERLNGWLIETVEWHVDTLQPVSLVLRHARTRAEVRLSVPLEPGPPPAELLDKLDQMEEGPRMFGLMLTEMFMGSRMTPHQRYSRMAGMVAKDVERRVKRGRKRVKTPTAPNEDESR